MCYEKYLSDSVLRQQTTRKRGPCPDLCPAYGQRQKHIRVVPADDTVVFVGFCGEQGRRQECRGPECQCRVGTHPGQTAPPLPAYLDRDAYVTAERVKSAYLGMGEEYETLLEALDKFNRDFKQHVGVDRAQSTYRKYDNVRKRLAEFLSEKLHREDIPLKELTETFITDYDLYLRSEKGLTPSCVCIYTKPLKMVVTKAHNAGVIARNPFADYHPKKITKDRGYLIESELQQLMNHKFTFEGYGKVRDMFVFSCFTGMAHADVKGLTRDMLQRSFDGELWIVKKRQKTNVPFKIKLCGITKRIIDKYKREVAGTNLVLPVPDIAYCNRILKKIAAEVGIDKTITYHMARHTFATTNALAQGIRIEVVSRMLGHTNIKTTQIYAKVTDDMLAKGFDEMAGIYADKYNLAQ